MQLPEIAAEIRSITVETIARSGRGHYGGALSCVDILTAIYFGGVLKDGDRFILSKGHAGSALYATLARAGILDPAHLATLNHGGLLGEEPHRQIPGVVANTGSLGHGLGLACGLATAALRDGTGARTFVLMGDGECWEGSVWEAAMFAAHHCLDITVIVDRNRLAIGGETEFINALGPLDQKWEAFGWRCDYTDGHSPNALQHELRNRNPGVLCLIADTVKGKGVSFMENAPQWHHGAMTPEQLAQAREELGTTGRLLQAAA